MTHCHADSERTKRWRNTQQQDQTGEISGVVGTALALSLRASCCSAVLCTSTESALVLHALVYFSTLLLLFLPHSFFLSYASSFLFPFVFLSTRNRPRIMLLRGPSNITFSENSFKNVCCCCCVYVIYVFKGACAPCF